MWSSNKINFIIGITPTWGTVLKGDVLRKAGNHGYKCFSMCWQKQVDLAPSRYSCTPERRQTTFRPNPSYFLDPGREKEEGGKSLCLSCWGVEWQGGPYWARRGLPWPCWSTDLSGSKPGTFSSQEWLSHLRHSLPKGHCPCGCVVVYFFLMCGPLYCTCARGGDIKFMACVSKSARKVAHKLYIYIWILRIYIYMYIYVICVIFYLEKYLDICIITLAPPSWCLWLGPLCCCVGYLWLLWL